MTGATPYRVRLATLTALALAFALVVPSIAQAAAAKRAAVGETPTPQFYRLQAHFLDGLPEPAELVFVYLDEDREIARDEIAVPWTDQEYLLLPIPHQGLNLWRTADLRRPLLEVWLGNTQMEELDRDAFDAYQFRLHIRHGDELRTTFGLETRAARPGGLEGIWCNSPCGGGCTPSADYDCDGVANNVDNCTDYHNPGQADCDNDGAGDACDIMVPYVNSGPEEICRAYTYLTRSIYTNALQHKPILWTEQKQIDPTACNSPDRWQRTTHYGANCDASSWTPSQCCASSLGLKDPIEAHGGTTQEWCYQKLNQNFCH